LTSILSGAVGNVALLGYGSSLGGIDVNDLTNTNLQFISQYSAYSFTVPRDGVIDAVSAYFANTAALSLIGTTVTVRAQLYKFEIGDTNFSAIPGSLVTLAPAITGLVNIGTASTGITTSINYPVLAQTRIILVFSISVTGVSLVNTISGYASGGISIL
jgi:BclB C-terminal domain-containing protein